MYDKSKPLKKWTLVQHVCMKGDARQLDFKSRLDRAELIALIELMFEWAGRSPEDFGGRATPTEVGGEVVWSFEDADLKDTLAILQG